MQWITTSSLRSMASPALARRSSSTARPEDMKLDRFESSSTRAELPQRGSRLGLWGAAGMALVAATPQVAHAGNVAKVAVKQVPSLTDIFSKSETTVGDYSLNLRPMDLDLRPRLSGGKPELRLRGTFLDAELSKTTQLSEDWTQTQGLRGRLRGELRTSGEHQAGMSLEGFRRWEGSLGGTMRGMAEVSLGNYSDFTQNTSSVGIHFRQELKGGEFEFANQPLSWHVEGRQIYHYTYDGTPQENHSPWNYEFLLGVRRDFPMKIFGKNATVSTIVGPELQGDQQQPFEIKPKVKVRVRF